MQVLQYRGKIAAPRYKPYLGLVAITIRRNLMLLMQSPQSAMFTHTAAAVCHVNAQCDDGDWIVQ